MALSNSCLSLMAKEAIPLLSSFNSSCTLGFPDMGSSLEDLLKIFNLKHINQPTFLSVLQALGFERNHVLDVSAYENADISVNLNFPYDSDNKYDFIVDNGTLEHCFNVGQAFFNIKHMCSVGGVIFHNNPANWVGHGFWNMSPCVYFDFYRANGFEVNVYWRSVESGISTKIEYKPKKTEVLPAKKYIIHAIAKKIHEMPDIIPTQNRFVSLHKAHF
jgi:hypothetical protein